MNLEESDKFLEKQRKTEQKKKVVMLSIVLCAILVALLIIMIIYLQYQDSLKLKMYIDGTQVNISSDLLYQENNTTYINVKTISEMFGYTYTKGEYKKYNENEESCYISNGLELVAMTAEKDSLIKYIEVSEGANLLTAEGPYGTNIQVKSENGTASTYNLQEPVKLINNQLYMPFDLLTDVFNVLVNTSEQNRIRIYTLPSLFQNAIQVAGNLGYTNVSGTYENIRSIVYGLIVVGKNDDYGVIDANNGEEILSIKYNDVEFIQNVKEFFVHGEDTVGLVDKTGKTIIKPTEYDDISILDELEQLYLVKKDGKYGVLNRKGEVVIHVDYDRIGLKKIEDFKMEDMRNSYLLFDKCIVVELDSEYGVFSIEGEELLKTVYEQLGYLTTSTDVGGEESVLLLPPSTGIKGIVLKFNGLYGIYDLNKKSIIIPCLCTRIYSITKMGETKYYMEFDGQQIELDEYLTSYNLKSEKINSSNNITDDVIENTNSLDVLEENVPDEQIENDSEIIVENE